MSRAARKLALLKRSGLFATETPGTCVEQAITAEELKAAYRLVHDVYVERGYCSEHDWGMRLRIFEASSKMGTFVGRTRDGAIVGVLSVVADCDEFLLPSDAAFGTEIAQLREGGHKLCEVTNQAIHPEYRKSALPTQLMQCAMAHGITMGYQRAIATVSPGHTGFYNMLNFFEIGPKRSYSRTIDDPVIALCGDLNIYRANRDGLDEVGAYIHRFMTTENPFMNHVAQWAKGASATFKDTELLKNLFTCWSSFLEECSESEVSFIESKWGWELFDRVTEPRVENDNVWKVRETQGFGIRCDHQLSECWPPVPDLLAAS